MKTGASAAMPAAACSARTANAGLGWGFKTSKGTIQFTAAKPLPALLIRKLVRARVRETTAND